MGGLSRGRFCKRLIRHVFRQEAIHALHHLHKLLVGRVNAAAILDRHDEAHHRAVGALARDRIDDEPELHHELIGEAAPALTGATAAAGTEGAALAVSKAAHKTVKAVGEDIEKLAFNKVVARLYELVNALAAPLAEVAAGKADAALAGACRQAVEMLVAMMAPMMPHLAEECWTAIGGEGLIAEAAWPDFDAALVTENEITYPVQINGKKRGDLTIGRDADKQAVEQAVLELDVVQKALNGAMPKKIVVVPQRIVNVVV